MVFENERSSLPTYKEAINNLLNGLPNSDELETYHPIDSAHQAKAALRVLEAMRTSTIPKTDSESNVVEVRAALNIQLHEELKDEQYLQTQKEVAAKQLSPEQQAQLNEKATQLIAQEKLTNITSEILDFLEKNGTYTYVATYIKETTEQLESLTTEWASLSPQQRKERLQALRATTSLSLRSGVKLNIFDILPHEHANALTRIAQLGLVSGNHSARTESQLAQAHEFLSSPATPILIIRDVENKGALSNQRIETYGHALSRTESEAASQFTAAVEWYTLQRIFENTIHDSELSPVERQYLNAQIAQTLVWSGICSASIARELSTGGILPGENPLLDVITTFISDEVQVQKKKKGSKWTRLALTGLTAITLIGGQYLSTSEGRNDLKGKIAFVGDFMKGLFATEDKDSASEEEQNEQQSVSQAEIDALIQEAQQKREAQLQRQTTQANAARPEQPTQVAEPRPPTMPERNFNAEKITEENLSWSEDAYGISNRSTSEAGINVESFLKASTKIDWVITENKTNANLTHLIQNVRTRYDATTDNYEAPFFKKGFDYNVPADVSEADVQMLARRLRASRTIPLSVPYGMHVSSAEVAIINKDTNERRIVPLSVVFTELGEYALSVPEFEDSRYASFEEEIEIKVGFSEGIKHTLSENFLEQSADDEGLKDLSILPTDLQSLIQNLNNAETLSDIEKLSALKHWFEEHQIYSMDDRRYTSYYTSNPFSFENYYRRYFGTGNSATDPSYIDNPDLVMKATCEPNHEAYLFAARFLRLQHGKAVFLDGYLNNGYYGTEGAIITKGSAHGFAGYLDKAGNLHILDVQPHQIDQYTKDILDKLPHNNSNTTQLNPESYTQLNFWPETNWLGSNHRPPEIVEPRLPYKTPWIEHFKQAFEAEHRQNLEIGDWQMIKTGIESNWVSNGELTTGINSNNLYGAVIFNDEGWSNANTSETFITYNYILESLKRRNIDIPIDHRGFPMLEEMATIYRGRETINDGNALLLPSAGVISPRSVRVVEITRDEQGKEYLLPAPVSHIRYRPNGINGYDYQLVLDLEPHETQDKVYQIEYATMSSMRHPLIPMSEEEAKKEFAIQSRDLFGDQFAAFLAALDKVQTIDDFLNLQAYGVTYPETFLSEDSLIAYNQPGTEKLDLDKLKLWTIGFYLNTNYTLTGNAERSKVALGQGRYENNIFWDDYIKRVTSNPGETIDPYTANYVLLTAAQTIQSQDHEYALPVRLTSTTFTTYFGPDFQHDFMSRGKEAELWGERFNTNAQKLAVTLYTFRPEQESEDGAIMYASGMYSTLGVDVMDIMDEDRLTKDAMAAFLKEQLPVYESTYQLQAVSEYIVQNTLSEGERSQLTISENISLWWQDYRDNYTAKYRDYALAAFAFLLTEELIRRSMRKYKSIDANKVGEIIKAVQNQYEPAQLHKSPVWQSILELNEKIFQHRSKATIQREKVSLRDPRTWPNITIHDPGFLNAGTLEILKRSLMMQNTLNRNHIFNEGKESFLGENKLTRIGVITPQQYDGVSVQCARLWLWASGNRWVTDVMLEEHRHLLEKSGFHIDSYKLAIDNAIEMPEDEAREYLRDWIRGLYTKNPNLADYLTDQIMLPIYTLARQENEQLTPSKK